MPPDNSLLALDIQATQAAVKPMRKAGGLKQSPSLLFDILTTADEHKAEEKLKNSVLDTELTVSAASEVCEEPKAKARVKFSPSKQTDTEVCPVGANEPPQGLTLADFTPERILEELLGDLFVHPDSLTETGMYGEGAFATVHMCSVADKRSGLRQMVAVKQLRPEVLKGLHDLREFLTEANLLRKMHHTHIVSIKGFGARDLSSLESMRSSMYVVMEAMEGGNLKMMVLRQMTSNSRVYSATDAVRWCIHIASAMNYLHNVCKPIIIHRDLKLENVLLSGGPLDNSVAKLADFGLHKRARYSQAAETLQTYQQDWSTHYRANNDSDYEKSYYGGNLYYAMGGTIHGGSMHAASRHAPASSIHNGSMHRAANYLAAPTPMQQSQATASVTEIQPIVLQTHSTTDGSPASSVHGRNTLLPKTGSYHSLLAMMPYPDNSQEGRQSSRQSNSHIEDTVRPFLSEGEGAPDDASVHRKRMALIALQDPTLSLAASSTHSLQPSPEPTVRAAAAMASCSHTTASTMVSCEVAQHPPPDSTTTSIVNPAPIHSTSSIAITLPIRSVATGAALPVVVGSNPGKPAAPAAGMSTIFEDKRISIDSAAPPGKQFMQNPEHSSTHASASIAQTGTSAGETRPPKGKPFSQSQPVPRAPGAKLTDATSQVGSLMYMAPELVIGHVYNEKVDVFSFAIMLYELFKGRLLAFKPELMTGTEDSVLQYAQQRASGFREPIPVHWPHKLRALLAACWAQDPADRPGFGEIAAELKALEKDPVMRAMPIGSSSAGGGCCIMM